MRRNCLTTLVCVFSVLLYGVQCKNYKLYHEEWTAFQSWCYCDCVNGTLATFQNLTERSQLDSLGVTGWIGLYRIPYIGQWVWMDGSNNDLIPPSDLPGTSGRYERCAYINGTTLVAQSCDKPYKFVCEFTEQAQNETDRYCYKRCSSGEWYLDTNDKETTALPIWITTDRTPGVEPSTLGTTATESTPTSNRLTSANVFDTTGFESTVEALTGEGITTGITIESTSSAVDGTGNQVTFTNGWDLSTLEATDLWNTASSAASYGMPSVEVTTQVGTTHDPHTTLRELSTAAVNSEITTENWSSPGLEVSVPVQTSPETETSIQPQETKITTTDSTTRNQTTSGPHGKTNASLIDKITALTTEATEIKPTTSDLVSVPGKATSAALQRLTSQMTTTTTVGNIESAEEAVGLLEKAEEQLLEYIGSQRPIPAGVVIQQLSSRDLDLYDESNPLAELPSGGRVNRLIPGGLKDGDKFVAVVAQLERGASQIVSALNNATQKPKSVYDQESFAFDELPLMSITAVKVDDGVKSIIPAATSFAFNLTRDRTLEIVAGMQRNTPQFSNLYEDTKIIRRAEFQCRFVDVKRHQLSADGCSNHESSVSGLVRCDCDHTTSFAVLLSLSSFTMPSGVKITSFVTESLTVVFLILTLIVLVRLRRKIRNDRTVVQINLSIALLLLHVCNLFHDPAHGHQGACEVFAVATHFFLLASAAWMLVEGVVLVHKTTGGAMNLRSTKRAKAVRLAVGWGIPGIVVLASAAPGFATDTYMQINPLYARMEKMSPKGSAIAVSKYTQCWLNKDSGVLAGAVVAPVLLALFLNALILCRMGYFVYTMSRKAERFKPTHQRTNSTSSHKSLPDIEHIKASVKAVACLMPILGLPWIIGILAGTENYEASVTFMYLNALVNGLQGVILFVIYCVTSAEVTSAARAEWRKSRASKSASSGSDSRAPSFGKDTPARRRPSEDSDRIFGVHQATRGRFSTLPKD